MVIKGKVSVVVVFLVAIMSISLSSALFVDNSSLVQTLYDCGNLTTTNAVYTMNQSVSTTGSCFNITANNVTLDGGRFIISGDDSSTDYGIFINGSSNFTVRNIN
ncbi:MAG: hypothetical protein WCP89_00285, partial [archaeon]